MEKKIQKVGDGWVAWVNERDHIYIPSELLAGNRANYYEVEDDGKKIIIHPVVDGDEARFTGKPVVGKLGVNEEGELWVPSSLLREGRTTTYLISRKKGEITIVPVHVIFSWDRIKRQFTNGKLVEV